MSGGRLVPLWAALRGLVRRPRPDFARELEHALERIDPVTLRVTTLERTLSDALPHGAGAQPIRTGSCGL